MLIFIQEIGLQLFLWLLQLIDGLMEIFSAISGVANVNYHGQQVNIVEFIVGDSTIGAVFWCIFITAVGLTCIFTIVGLVKNMIANNRNVSTIVGKFFLALLGAMAMLAVVILGILIAKVVQYPQHKGRDARSARGQVQGDPPYRQVHRRDGDQADRGG